MSALNISLHPAQLTVFRDPRRFLVVTAGRRFGKTHLACSELITTALTAPMDVAYVAPTFGQAKDLVWDPLHEMAGDLVIGSHVNDGWIKLKSANGTRKIHVKGADRPETMRGTGRAKYVLDEFADMKPQVWEEIVRPQLADVQGSALFIGTPKGRNHFYKMAMSARDGFDTGDGRVLHPDWGYYHFTSYDNPFINPQEIEDARNTLSSFAFRQEFLASFEAAASDIFKPEHCVVDSNEPADGQWHIAVDLAGFADVGSARGSKLASLDQTAIAVVKIRPNGDWWVKEVIYGRWGIRETALRIVKVYRDYRPPTGCLGIEKGALLNAIAPILREEMVRFGVHFVPVPLTHGNKKKIDRVVWALQGRMERQRIRFNEGDWNAELFDQLMQFPDAKSHDDLVDALAYVAQLMTPGSGLIDVYDRHDVQDDITGW